MRLIPKISIFFIFTGLLSMPLYGANKNEASVVTVIKDIRTSLEQVTTQAAQRITKAINTKNSILASRLSDSLKEVKIAEQDEIIAAIKQELLKLADNAIKIADETEQQASYLSQFMAGAQNLSSKIMTPLKYAYYGYTDQERALARAVITELEKLKKLETNLVIKKEIDNEIYKQKLISGDEMITQKKLLIGAAVAAAVVAGVVLTSRYLNAPSAPIIIPESVSRQQLQPSVTKSEPVDPFTVALEINAKLQTATAEEKVYLQKQLNQKIYALEGKVREVNNLEGWLAFARRNGKEDEVLRLEKELAEYPEDYKILRPLVCPYAPKEDITEEERGRVMTYTIDQLADISRLREEHRKVRDNVIALQRISYQLKKDLENNPIIIEAARIIDAFEKEGIGTKEDAIQASKQVTDTDLWKLYIVTQDKLEKEKNIDITLYQQFINTLKNKNKGPQNSS